MHQDLTGSPYFVVTTKDNESIYKVIQDIGERVELLRSTGRLSDATLRDYFSERRFEQIAESNAIEGSTLSVGETELAVMKGVTISGHDPAYSRDAQTLARALDELVELAKKPNPTDIEQVKRIHELILGDRPSAGVFRNEEVRIRGASHVPPRTWREIMAQMEEWEKWSLNNANLPPLLRASVLHAWLEHIHPFIDGNGRTGRAITNLELIRAGYPAIVIRRKDRERYLDALQMADQGDVAPFIEIVAGRSEDALRDLERAAARSQGYDAARERYVKVQRSRLEIWNAGVHLLCARIRSRLLELVGDFGRVDVREYDELGVEDFIELCEGRTVRLSWAFIIHCELPGRQPVERLAWAGVMSYDFRNRVQGDGRPALCWSAPNPDGFPKWRVLNQGPPVGRQMTIVRDRWTVLTDQGLSEFSPTELADEIASHIYDLTIPGNTL